MAGGLIVDMTAGMMIVDITMTATEETVMGTATMIGTSPAILNGLVDQYLQCTKPQVQLSFTLGR
jgi:hypothetical protein